MLCQVELRPFVSRHGWGRNRTADTRVFSAVLYRLSYPARRPLRESSGGGIRTHDLVVNSHPLWPLSYPGSISSAHVGFSNIAACVPTSKNAPRQHSDTGPERNSGGRIRTCDLRVMSPTSYQTAPPRSGRRSYPSRSGMSTILGQLCAGRSYRMDGAGNRANSHCNASGRLTARLPHSAAIAVCCGLSGPDRAASLPLVAYGRSDRVMRWRLAGRDPA